MNWSTLHSKPRSLHGNPDSKANIFIEKFKLVHQRTARHKLFAAPAIANQLSSTAYSLKAVEHLLGSSSKENNIIILGMLVQLKEVNKHNTTIKHLKVMLIIYLFIKLTGISFFQIRANFS